MPKTSRWTPAHIFNAFIPGTAYFIGDQAVANLDYNATSKDTLALKYYYQHDPTVAPYAYSNVPGFTQKLDAGSQVFSINNTYLIRSNLSTQETLGFLREKLYNTNDQAFGPSEHPWGSYPSASMDTFGSTYFPGVSIIHVLGNSKVPGIGDTLNIGPGAGAPGIEYRRLPEPPAALRQRDLGYAENTTLASVAAIASPSSTP